MPDNPTWEALVDEKARKAPPLSVAALDQVDAVLDECARGLGFTLTDRATVEAAIMGVSAAYFVQSRIGKCGPNDESPEFARELILTVALVHWLLVERLHRLEGT